MYLNDDVKLSAVNFDSDGSKDFREVSCRWTGVSAHNGQDVSSHVTHFDWKTVINDDKHMKVFLPILLGLIELSDGRSFFQHFEFRRKMV